MPSRMANPAITRPAIASAYFGDFEIRPQTCSIRDSVAPASLSYDRDSAQP